MSSEPSQRATTGAVLEVSSGEGLEDLSRGEPAQAGPTHRPSGLQDEPVVCRKIRRLGVVARRHFVGLGLPGLLAYLSCFGYIAFFSWLSFTKYYTFNDTFADLGLYNQQLWLLLHGGFGLLNSSHFNTQIYAFQYQEPVIFLVFGFYALVPGIPTLLVMESAALGLAGVVLYHLTRLRLASGWAAFAMVLVYLTYFAVASGNLVDFHLENFAPLFFLSMALAWFAGRKKTSLACAILTASINPLMLLIACFFVIYTGMPERLDPRDPLGFFKSTIQALFTDVSKFLIVIALLGLFVIYRLTGILAVAGAGPGATGLGFTGTLLFAINSKLALLVLLFGALAFLPLLDVGAMFVLLPYIGFVLYSADSSNWTQFGLMYTEMAVGPLFMGAVNALRKFGFGSQRAPEFVASLEREQSGRDLKRAYHWTLRQRGPDYRPLGALLIVALVFGIVYFPSSPVNTYVQGGYFAGNHDYAGITTITPPVQFLWQAIQLVPASAAVLTQNSIPQLTGREYYQIAPEVHTDIPYNYLLMDGSENYFTTVGDIVPYAQNALENGTFGIVAEGWGALLLAQGYSAPPKLYDPTAANYTGSELALYSGAIIGTTIVGSGPAYSLWYGPSATLYPGTYTVTFAISSNTTAYSSTPAINLDVVSGGGAVTYAQMNLFPSNFTSPDAIDYFTLSFTVTQIVSTMEYRGMFPSGDATLTLHYVDVTQTRLLG